MMKKKYRFIEIYLDNPGDYSDVALFVDKISFLERAEVLRKKYGLNYDYPPADTEKIYSEVECKAFRDQKLKNEFEADVERVRTGYGMPPHFSKVIKSAIIYGIVGFGDYSRAYLEEQEIFPPIEEYDEYAIPDMKYSIVIHPGTTKEDVEKVFKKFKERVKIHFKGNPKEKHKYYRGYEFDISFPEMKPGQPSAKTVRKWYQKMENGEGPLKIALEIKGYNWKQYKKLVNKDKCNYKNKEEEDNKKIQRALNGVYIQRDTVKTQVRRYRKLVRASFL